MLGSPPDIISVQNAGLWGLCAFEIMGSVSTRAVGWNVGYDERRPVLGTGTENGVFTMDVDTDPRTLEHLY